MERAELRLVGVPDSAPPYDCDSHGGNCLPQRPGVLVAPWISAAPEAARLRPTAGSPAGREAGRLAALPGTAEAPAAWPRQFAQAMVEILAGVRPVRQVMPYATEGARAQIRRLIPRFAAGGRPRIQRVLASWPAADVVEVTVIADFGSRTRALAMRLEQVAARRAAPGRPPRPAHWLCAAIEAG